MASASSADPPTPGGNALPRVESSSTTGGGVTVTTVVTPCWRLPEVAVTMSGYDAGGVPGAADTVTVLVPAPPGTVTGVAATVSPLGADTARVTSPVKPSAGLTVTGKLPDEPAATVTTSDAVSAKSGSGALAAVKAAIASTRPKPVAVSGPAAPMSTAVPVRISRCRATDRPGWAASTRARTPATCGAAIEVPDATWYSP